MTSTTSWRSSASSCLSRSSNMPMPMPTARQCQNPTCWTHTSPEVNSMLLYSTSCQRRRAKASALSGLSACSALSTKGATKATRPGHGLPQAKLTALTARHKKLKQCKVFTCQARKAPSLLSTLS